MQVVSQPSRRSRGRLPALVALVPVGASVLVATGLQIGAAAPASALTGDVRLHDPSVIKVGNCYYAFSTGFERDSANPSGSITEYRTCDSTPAGGWTKLTNVWSSTPSWIASMLGRNPPNIWAPDIKSFNGKYYLYYSASIWGTAYAVMGLAVATDIDGPWVDQGVVTDVNYPIDPTVDWGPDGRLYVTWGSFGGVYMHVVDSATGKLSTTDHNLWQLAKDVEAPTIVLDGGYYYLFGSKGVCCSGTSSNYYTVVGRSTSITGPYVDQAGVALTAGGGTVVLRGAWPRVAAGGADAYDDGAQKYLAYHYYDGDAAGRETLDLRQITFGNGWPLLAAPVGTQSNHLLNNNSNQCVDVWYASTAENASVNQAPCNSGANQRWTTRAVGANQQFVSEHSGKCLAIADNSTAAGAAAVQRSCDGSTGQLWRTTPTIGGYVTLSNVNSGQCLEVYGLSTAEGAALNQWPCNGGAHQQWLPV